MGGRRKIGDRKAGITQTGKSERAKVLPFDDPHRGLRTPNVRRPAKRPEKLVAPPSMMRRAMRAMLAFFHRISRILGSQARGAEPSGKRRA